MPVNPNLNTAANNYTFGPSGEQYLNVPNFGIFGPTQVPRGMLPNDLSTSRLTQGLTAAQLARLLAMPAQAPQQPYTPSVQPTPSPVVPGGITPPQTGPTPSYPALPGPMPPQTGSPQPVGIAPPPLSTPTIPFTSQPIQPPTGTVTIPYDDTAGGVFGPAPPTVNVTPSALANGGLSGGPAVMPNDFGTASAGKTGSSGSFNTNDLINGAIGASGLFGPMGTSLGLGLAKGLADLGIYNGDTYNTNGLSGAQSLLYGPSMGERAVNFASGLFGNGGLPISAANDPTAQIGNQTAGQGLTGGLFSGGPATMPTSSLGGLVAGNGFGSGAMSGGWMFPSMDFSSLQLGDMPLDLSSLSDLMQGGKLPNSGT